MPTGPIFGGVIGNNVWYGGPFNENFDGVTNAGPANPFCYRHDGIEQASKQFEKRVAGLTTKFKKQDPTMSLRNLGSKVQRHVEQHGLDTGFYMHDPTDSTKVLNILAHHSKYTMEDVVAFWNSKSANLDHHMEQCLKDSGDYLLNSIEQSLQNTIELSLGELPPYGPFIWMLIVAECQSDSIRRAGLLSTKFERTKLADFAGENVQDYVTAVSEILNDLERSGNLPHDHLTRIIDQLTKSSNEELRVTFINKRTSVEQFIRATMGKSQLVAKQHPKYIHYSTLLNDAKALYQTLIDSDQWGMKNAKRHEAMIADLQSQVKSLTCKLANVDKNGRDGKDNKNQESNSKQEKKIKLRKGRDGFDIVEPKSLPSRWKYIPPETGHQEKRIVGKDKFFWCGGPCKRWNTTHTTSQHVRRSDRERSGNSRTPEANTAALVPKHNAWFGENDA